MKEEENKKIVVVGHSVINHNVRHKLGLTVSEYVLLQYLQDLLEDGMVPDEYNAMSMLGESVLKVVTGMDFLLKKKLLIPKGDGGKIEYDIYPEWYKAHKEKGFEFALFWQPISLCGETIEWRNSSKESVRKKFVQVLKICPIEQLVYTKLRYFFSKFESKSLDYVMMAETFLGPSKHYMVNYRLKPETETLLASYIYENYGEGSQLDLTGMVPKGSVQPRIINQEFEDREQGDDG